MSAPSRRLLGALLCVAAAVAVAVAGDGRGDDADAGSTRAAPTATVSTGSLSGKWMTTRDGRDIAAFEGVPYAAPPVGQLRFKEPQPAAPWPGVLQAASPASPCIQRDVYRHEQDIVGAEDCLYANVYVPEGVSHTEPLPVLFYIHGGGWLSGTGSIYGPEYLLDKDVVLVTFNYRLGPLGFLSTGDDAVPGNNGLKDMVHALRWVHDNIRAFGGDPGSVTIAGQSAGAASVHLLLLSPLAKGLFHRAILMSGNAFTTWAFHSPLDARRQARVLARHTQCPEAPGEAMVQCLRTRKAEDIVSVDQLFMRWDIHPHMPFKATVEVAGGAGAFMDVHPRQAYGLDRLGDVPVMTGITAQDGAVLVAMLLDNSSALADLNENFNFIMECMASFDSYPPPMREETLDRVRRFYFGEGPIDKGDAFNLIDMATDLAFLYPTMQVIKMQKKYGKAPLYFYEFAHMSQSHRSYVVTFGAPSPDFGVCHSDDLMYLFPMDASFPDQQPGTDDVFVSRRFVDYVARFIRTGKPTVDRSWQAVAHPDAAEYMHIGSPGDIQMRANLAPERMRLWSEVPIQLGRMVVPHDEL